MARYLARSLNGEGCLHIAVTMNDTQNSHCTRINSIENHIAPGWDASEPGTQVVSRVSARVWRSPEDAQRPSNRVDDTVRCLSRPAFGCNKDPDFIQIDLGVTRNR